MNLREVTIGRSENCDIYLDQRCKYASNMHGTIYYDGNQLMFRDSSSNGTMINNVSVRKSAVPIRHGDSILIAGRYPINWSQIDSFFPYTPQQNRPIGTIVDVGGAISQTAGAAEPLNLSKWSWGAFALSWLWGFFNGCWWMFLVKFGLYLLELLLIWVPFAVFVFSLLDLGLSIFFGIKGTEWAWNNKTWSSIADFRQTQATWNKVGFILFMIGIIITILGVVAVLVSLVRYV